MADDYCFNNSDENGDWPKDEKGFYNPTVADVYIAAAKAILTHLKR